MIMDNERRTLFDKVWDAHVIKEVENGPTVLYIDRHYIHEVTSPQAFSGLENRGAGVFRPGSTVAMPDHNVPTENQPLPIQDELSRLQVEKLEQNCSGHAIKLFPLNHPSHGIVHVTGPELGLTLPGMTVVCGDSHTSTHGAFGCVSFGIGTSEVEMVLAAQAVMQTRPKRMRITLEGSTGEGVTAKDIILYIISRLTAGGGTGYFIEFAGEAVRQLSMEGRMTLCNMSIGMGARGGMVAPDEKTCNYLRGREFAPAEDKFDHYCKRWMELATDEGAVFDLEHRFDASLIEPMITYGTNPGMGVAVNLSVPYAESLPAGARENFMKSLDYMGFSPGEKIEGKKIDYVFVGSCTNGRIEDLRLFASMVKGKRKAPGVTVWIVPGSRRVEEEARSEGLVTIFEEAGFTMRQPGCSACLAMNDDKIPAGKYAVSTSNRNFEGRQGPGARTLLASPLTAAATALTGRITDPRKLLNERRV
jgi:3-isopropylmalate/(R)-2-methylmalate dehydratase large subunit